MKAFRILGLVVALSATTITGSMITGCDRGVQKYDTLVDKDEACTRAWGDYESNLQRRADMTPQLVAIVQGSAHHEQNTLTAVIQARASATRPEIHLDASKGDFEDPAKIAAFQQAQSQLGTAIGKLMMVQEQYPELQANKAFANLQIQIEGTENRLLRAREVYNGTVESFNTELRHVSGKILNPITGHEFKPREYFKADEGARTAPVISFDNTAPVATSISAAPQQTMPQPPMVVPQNPIQAPVAPVPSK